MPMSPELGRAEPNPEIRDLLRSSRGMNLGMRYLPSAFAYNSLVRRRPDADLASAIVWFDAFVTNVDRTDRNVNMLLWQDKLWLIDHGAALYFHHDWRDYLERSLTPFAMIKQHTLLHLAGRLPQADARLRPLLDTDFFTEIVNDIPSDWLAGETYFADEQEHRAAYVAYLTNRLSAAPIFSRRPFVPGPHVYDYAVVRVVPYVEREEFINAGIILFCRPARYLGAKIELDYERLRAIGARLRHCSSRGTARPDSTHVPGGRADRSSWGWRKRITGWWRHTAPSSSVRRCILALPTICRGRLSG